MSEFDTNIILEFLGCFGGLSKATVLLESMQHHTNNTKDKMGEVTGEIIIEDKLLRGVSSPVWFIKFVWLNVPPSL